MSKNEKKNLSKYYSERNYCKSYRIDTPHETSKGYLKIKLDPLKSKPLNSRKELKLAIIALKKLDTQF